MHDNINQTEETVLPFLDDSFIKEKIFFDDLLWKDTAVELLFPAKSFDILPEISLILWDKKSGSYFQKTPERSSRNGQDVLTFDLIDFIFEYSKIPNKRFKAYLFYKHDGQPGLHRLTLKRKKNKKLEKERDFTYRYFEGLNLGGPKGRETVLVPYGTYNMLLSFVILEQRKQYKEQFGETITDLRINGSTLYLSVQCKERNLKPRGVILSYRDKLMRLEHKMKCNVQIHPEGYLISAALDLRAVDFKQFYWDLRLILSRDKRFYEVPLYNLSKTFEKNLTSLFNRNTYYFRDGYMIYPYVTNKKTIALYYREKKEYDSFIFRLKERLAYFWYELNKTYYDGKNIELVFEKYSITAQDNAFYYFQYCMGNNLTDAEKRNIYYVIDKSSKDYRKLIPYKKHVVNFLSFRHLIYIQAAKYFVTAETAGHCYAWRCKDSPVKQKLQSKKCVFLQHGVIALKRIPNFSKNNKNNNIALFVASSDYEKNLIINYLHYLPEEVIVTGLARWDILRDTSTEKKEILMMPTWRNWLEEVNDDVFIQSSYYKNYMQLLESPKLLEILKKNNLTLKFYIHPKFKDYIENFDLKSDYIEVIKFGDVPLNELIMSCSMMVTDYSSACWDVYYQEKPIVFYQFDERKYNLLQGSYIDFETELFGDRVLDTEELVDAIDYYCTNNFQEKEKYAKMRNDYFAYRDHNNSKRIRNAIVRQEW